MEDGRFLKVINEGTNEFGKVSLQMEMLDLEGLAGEVFATGNNPDDRNNIQVTAGYTGGECVLPDDETKAQAPVKEFNECIVVSTDADIDVSNRQNKNRFRRKSFFR